MSGLFRIVAYGILCLPMMFVWTASYELIRNSGTAFPLFVVLYIADIFICALIHELGHAIAANLCGWRIKYIAVFPFAYYLAPRKLKLWHGRSGDIGGAVSIDSAPIKSANRVALFSLAGPLANFMFAGVLLAVVGAVSIPTIQNVVAGFAIVSLLLGLGNILPWRTRQGLRSDGMVLLSVVRGAVSSSPART